MSHAVISPRDILSLQEEAQNMGRNFYSKPKVHRTAARAARWYFRPSIPTLDNGAWVPKLGDRIYIGLCSEVSKREADRVRDEYCKTLNRTPAMVQSQIRFADLVEAYRQVYLPTLAISTQRGYETRINRHILPAFGDRQLCKIGPQEIQGWINEIDGTVNTRKVVLATLASIFEAAADWGYTRERNPCSRVKVGTGTREERDLTVPEPHEIAALLAVTHEPYTTAIEVGLYCGLRPGEVRGLVGRSVDPPYLRVIFNRDRKTGQLGSPKRRSQRRVALPEWLAGKLSALVTAPTALLWPDLEYSALWEHFNTRARMIGIWKPGFSLHTLRRCYATYRDELGAEGLQEAMGHRSKAMTDRYIKPGVRRQLEQVEAMRSMVVGGVQ